MSKLKTEVFSAEDFNFVYSLDYPEGRDVRYEIVNKTNKILSKWIEDNGVEVWSYEDNLADKDGMTQLWRGEHITYANKRGILINIENIKECEHGGKKI